MSYRILVIQDKDFYKSNPDILIMGDSHSMTSLNPLILGNAFNFASGGESYIQNYYKLKYILNNTSKKIKIIILPVDLHSFASYRTDIFTDTFHWVKYVDFIEMGLHKKAVYTYFVEYAKGKFFPYAGRTENFFKNSNEDLGDGSLIDGYFARYKDYSNEKNKTEIAAKQVEKHFKEKNYFNDNLVFYFKKIIALCDEYKIKLVLIKFPVTLEYYSQASQLVPVDKLYKNVNLIIANNPDIVLFDYQKEFFGEDHLFIDSDHLNTLGAARFSNLIKKRLSDAF